MHNKTIKRPIDKTVKIRLGGAKNMRQNQNNEIEIIHIQATNSKGEKEDGVMIHYGAEYWKNLSGLGSSSTMVFLCPEKISKGGVVKPEMRKKINEFIQTFFENYLDELSEALKKPLKENQ